MGDARRPNYAQRWWLLIFVLGLVGSVIATAIFYWVGDTLKAIFWLLVTYGLAALVRMQLQTLE